MRDACRIAPGAKANLDGRPTDDRLGIEKGNAQTDLAKLTDQLSVLHQRLYAEGSRSLLLVLQGLDTAGKDGTIRRVFTGLNPQGCDVESFKAPTPTEAAHDFLWRIHSALPAAVTSASSIGRTTKTSSRRKSSARSTITGASGATSTSTRSRRCWSTKVRRW